MVGVGPNGSESSLARVSLVNYHGAVIMDEFVRQREHVTDYRTFVSGIRPKDLVHGERGVPHYNICDLTDCMPAKSFQEVQRRVAELLEDRILIGHAVHNDLKVCAVLLAGACHLLYLQSLLLSHPRHSTCDTQICAGKARILKTKFPSLKKLVEHEFGVAIQRGEHSSVSCSIMSLYTIPDLYLDNRL